MAVANVEKVIYSKNPYIKTKKVRTLEAEFSVMHHLNKNFLQPEHE